MEFDFLFYSLLTQFFEFFWSYIFDENFNTEKVETFRQYRESRNFSPMITLRFPFSTGTWQGLPQTSKMENFATNVNGF